MRKFPVLLAFGFCELLLIGLFVLSLCLDYLGCSIYTGSLVAFGLSAITYVSLT